MKALLQCVPSILANVIEDCVTDIKSDQIDVARKERILQGLLFFLKNPKLTAIFRAEINLKILRSAARCIERCTASGPLDTIGGTFSIEVQVLVGFDESSEEV